MLLSALLAASVIAVGHPAAAAAMQPCLRAVKALNPGDIPLPDNFMPATCPAPPARAFGYDAAQGLSRVARPIAVGSEVAVYPEYGVDMVRPGERLHLVVHLGAVQIERPVEALQVARPGQALFVRDQDGSVFAVRYRSLAR